ncbi:hypothetical protein K488DRAFT_92563 [Vararia minispora EC-137]|uniref:Uncharacterized protein n=1 Tax=Vararia minispora EC-137 TaxID=1314806 RepID=A0ACB8Q3Y3_9AGAM|nr:hypothetical protein K488DRAFT_92563 [Vararia minispora EC-137]
MPCRLSAFYFRLGNGYKGSVRALPREARYAPFVLLGPSAVLHGQLLTSPPHSPPHSPPSPAAAASTSLSKAVPIVGTLPSLLHVFVFVFVHTSDLGNSDKWLADPDTFSDRDPGICNVHAQSRLTPGFLITVRAHTHGCLPVFPLSLHLWGSPLRASFVAGKSEPICRPT